MRERYRRLKDNLVHRATEAFTVAVQASMNPAKAAADAEEFRNKYFSLDEFSGGGNLLSAPATKRRSRGLPAPC